MSSITALLRNCRLHPVRFAFLLAALLGFSQMTEPVYAQGGGGKILFTSNRDRTGGGPGLGNWSDIYVMNPDGSGLVNLTNRSPESELRPAWSPDGTRIVFQREVAGTYHDTEIFVMNADMVTRRFPNRLYQFSG
jgi:Tol biopolymer transport system component